MVNIWTYEENQAIETDKVDMKPFKPTGKFFDDVQVLVRLFGTTTHPALRETSYRDKETMAAQAAAAADGADDEQKIKEITALNFYKYRLDKNSLRATFLCLPSAQIIQTLKFSNNGLTHSQLQTLTSYLAEDNCPVTNLFIDWNPLYQDDYQPGQSHLSGSNQLYEIPEPEDDQPEEISLFAKLISDAKKLQVLFLRACHLNDKDLNHIMLALKPDTQLPMNRNLKVLDLSYNKFSTESVQGFSQVFEQNRSLEFLGLAKNNLTTDDITPLLASFGKVPFPAEQVETYQAELKKRDAIVEKNKKLRQQKKPEEPVPILDSLETKTGTDSDGNEVVNYFLLKCPQFKHLNLCLNKIDDDSMGILEQVLQGTPDDFGLTLSGNQISGPVQKRIQTLVKNLHRTRVQEMRMADPNNATMQELEDIAQRRAAF